MSTDTWTAKGRVPYLVTVSQFSLAPGQQNLEAVRSRMTVVLAGLRWTTSEPTPVSLTAGPAYRLEGMGEWGRTVAYAFHRDGRGIILSVLDMNPSAEGIDPEQLARGFRIEARAMGPATSAAPGASATDPGAGTSSVVARCPVTSAEVEVAIGRTVTAPDVGIPFKNMTQNCSFNLTSGGGSVDILVFDAAGEGTAFWQSARADPNFPNVTAIPGLGDDAFVAGSPRFTHLFAVKGQIGLHVTISTWAPATLEQLRALGTSVLARV